MIDIVNPILQWLNSNPHWAAFATFIISAGESVAIIGTIVPGSVMMTAIGTLAGAGVIPLWLTVFCAILGAIVGDGISYILGVHFKDRIRQVWPFRNNPQWLDAGEAFFRKHGGKSVFFGRFVGPMRALVPLIAGMLGVKPVRFYIANIASAIGWAPAYMLPGILLGAASLELPPDIAAHILLMLFLVMLFIVLCVWSIIKIFFLINTQIDQLLTWIWTHLKNSRYANVITIALKHHNPKKTYGQLILAFYFIVTCIIFTSLACYIKSHGSAHLFLNNGLFHFFRSLRTPGMDNIAIGITLLGQPSLLPYLIIAFLAWLLFTKRFYLAGHIFALGMLTFGGVEIIKKYVQSARPWGTLLAGHSYSFPSGHTALAVMFYVGFALLLSRIYPARRRLILFTGITIALLVSISRLYLGAHWLTDIIAGWLFSGAILMLITISYNRKRDSYDHFGKAIARALMIFVITYGIIYTCFFSHYKQIYPLMPYPVYSLNESAWWNQKDSHIPYYRINRFGIAAQFLNLQWLEDLPAIEKTLLQQGWEQPPARDWISVIQRISDVESTENLPLVSPLHLDKNPALVLVKYTGNEKRVLVLRLWDSNLVIAPKQQHLWVGMVSIIPRTYNWILKRRADEITLTPQQLFTHTPKKYAIKVIDLPPESLKHKKYKTLPVVLLIKPKS